MPLYENRDLVDKDRMSLCRLFATGKRNGELDLERFNDRARDFVLERKHALQFAFICFRPEPETIACINQLLGYSNAITLARTLPSSTFFDI